MTYHPDFKLSSTKHQVLVTPELGDAARFSRYDPIGNQFLVDGDSLRLEDAGTYLIKFKARYFNATTA